MYFWSSRSGHPIRSRWRPHDRLKGRSLGLGSRKGPIWLIYVLTDVPKFYSGSIGGRKPSRIVRSPTNGRNSAAMIWKDGHGDGCTADIHNDDLSRIDPETSDVIVIERVPSESKEGLSIARFIKNCWVIEGADIEESNWSLGSYGSKNISRFGIKSDIEDFLIVSN